MPAASAPAAGPPSPRPNCPEPIPLPTTVQLSAPSGGALYALVMGCALFRSIDRGDSWKQLPLPTAATGMSFGDDLKGVVVGASGCEVWRSDDGGGAWRRLAATGLPPAGCQGGLSLVDADHGFLALVDSSPSPPLYRTGNGGGTWSAAGALPGSGPINGGVRRLEGVLHAVQGGSVIRSTDAGDHWQVAAALPAGYRWPALVTATRWLLIAPSSSRETTDGGATWHPYTSDYQQAAGVAPAICFADERTGYATVRGAIQRTLDGGAHWSRLRTPGT